MTRLSDLLSGVKPGFASRDNLDHGVFQLRMHNLTRDSRLDLTKRRRVGASARQVELQSVAKDDVLFNATNSPELVGKSALMPDLDETTVFSNHFLRLRVDRGRLEPGYLAHFLRYEFERGTFRGLAKAWVNQATVSRDRLEDLDIPLPPLNEQRRIAAILDRAAEVVSAYRTYLNLRTELHTAAFLSSFGDPLANPHRLPTKRVDEVGAVVTGNTPSRREAQNYGRGIEWLKSDNLGAEVASRAEETLSAVGRAKARTAPAGSILITCIAGSPASIGKCSMVDREAAFNQQINALIPGADVISEFLLWQFKAAPELVRQGSTGGMKGLVSKSQFSSIQVLLPPLKQQAEFVAKIRRLGRLSRSLDRTSSRSDELLASLQSRAFRGEL